MPAQKPHGSDILLLPREIGIVQRRKETSVQVRGDDMPRAAYARGQPSAIEPPPKQWCAMACDRYALSAQPGMLVLGVPCTQ